MNNLNLPKKSLSLNLREMSEKGCYYCGRPATSLEHVPPKCIFPEKKDTFGEDHRKNLITVPSCDEHNLDKSKDDEFLMACVTATVGNNRTGYIQTKTKLRRAFDRTNRRLLTATIRDAHTATWVAPNGAKFPVLIGQTDLPRLIGALEHISRGLYYHATGNRFLGTCHIIPDWIIFTEDPDLESIKLLSRVMIAQEKNNWVRYGNNPDVFEFHLGPSDEHGLIPMLMTFLGGTHVYVSFQPEGVKPPFRTLDEATSANPILIEVAFSPRK